MTLICLDIQEGVALKQILNTIKLNIFIYTAKRTFKKHSSFFVNDVLLIENWEADQKCSIVSFFLPQFHPSMA